LKRNCAQAKHVSGSPAGESVVSSRNADEAAGDAAACSVSCWNEMKYRSVDHAPAVSLAAIAILIVISAAALKYLGS
jgi:hypothetical protein